MRDLQSILLMQSIREARYSWRGRLEILTSDRAYFDQATHREYLQLAIL